MAENIQPGDRVRVYLESNFWGTQGWFDGIVLRIDPYSKYRSFYWVEMDVELTSTQGGKTSLVSVLNPKNIEKI